MRNIVSLLSFPMLWKKHIQITQHGCKSLHDVAYVHIIHMMSISPKSISSYAIFVWINYSKCLDLLSGLLDIADPFITIRILLLFWPPGLLSTDILSSTNIHFHTQERPILIVFAEKIASCSVFYSTDTLFSFIECISNNLF